MAILFDDGSTEYLQYGSPVHTTEPMTMAAWLYTDSIAIEESAMGIFDTAGGSTWYALELRGQDANDPVSAFQRGTADGVARSSSGPSANTWFHGCAVFTSSTSRAAFFNGGSKGTDSTEITTAGLDVTCIGGRRDSTPSAYWSGSIAECAIWSVALSDAEVALLAKGFSPLFFQPQNLVSYWPLIYLTDINDRIGDGNMTAYNTPVTAVHPPKIIYPSPLFSAFGAAAVPAGQPTMLRNITVPGTRQWQPQFPR